MSDPTTPTLESFLPRFGLSEFRHGQKEVISTVMAGGDCLCVMPTGGGKSLCYQLPALALDGLTLVVSPLIALMKDQVDQLQSLELPVSFVNSALPAGEQFARLDRAAAGEFRLLYVAPERFRSGRFLDAVRTAGVKLLAVDEAHCISEWGHDFRPDYARLGYFRRLLGNPPTLALTATATDRVRRDIVEQLDLREPKTYITGFARPNLFYEVQSPRSEREKPERLLEFLRQTPGSGIIYTSTRKRAEEVAERIAAETRRRMVVYHAGLLPDQRRAAQEDFMEGRRDVVVATNAFGMGIDKADVRFVVHYNIPGSLEAYYQEAGRAGRDGKTSRCLMFYHSSDRYIQEYFIDSAYPDREYVQAVYEYLCDIDEAPIQLTQDDIKQALGLPITTDGVGNCEQILEGAGVLERLIASQNMASVRIDSDLPTLVDLLPKQARTQRKVLQAVERLVGDRRQELVQFSFRELTFSDEFDQASIVHALRELCKLEAFTYVPPFRGRAIRMIQRNVPFDRLEIDFETLERRKRLEYEKLNQVIRFALTGACRQRDILRYFGETDAQRCGHCDNCRAQGFPASADAHPSRNGHPTDSSVALDAETREMAESCDEGLGVDDRSQVTAKDVPPSESGDAPIDARVLEAVRIVLSGVARTHARFPCGKNLIAQMLCGSTSAKVKKLRLDRLSTFGLLKHLTQQDVLVLIDALMALGCLRQIDLDRFRPVVELTEFGAEVMRNRASLSGSLPVPTELFWKLTGRQAVVDGRVGNERREASRDRESIPSSSAFTDSDGGPRVPDPDVLKSLKQWRGDLADEAGVPLHYILANDTLAELACRCPQTRADLLDIKGIGPVKADRYGDALLEIVAGTGDGQLRTPKHSEATDDAAASAPVGPTPEINPDSHASHPSAYWTHRVLQAGFSIDDCAAIRGLSRDAILEHVRQMAEDEAAGDP